MTKGTSQASGAKRGREGTQVWAQADGAIDEDQLGKVGDSFFFFFFCARKKEAWLLHNREGQQSAF